MFSTRLVEFQGKRVVGQDGADAINDQYHENVLLQGEMAQLRTRVKALQETVDTLRARNVQLLADRDMLIFSKKDEGAVSP